MISLSKLSVLSVVQRTNGIVNQAIESGDHQVALRGLDMLAKHTGAYVPEKPEITTEEAKDAIRNAIKIVAKHVSGEQMKVIAAELETQLERDSDPLH
ncbi:MAG: hypothetical protein GY838_05925 [bacterium]|nr:hypothetical protein [bacterium]